MKRFIRCMCMFLVLTIVFAVPAFAVETVAPKASSYFMSSSVYLCNVSGTSFEAWFEVTGTGRMEEIGANFIKIQRSSDGVNWTTVKTCLKENYSSFIDNNSSSHAAGVSYTGTRGYYYRAYIQLYAKNSSGTGLKDRYTSKIYIPTN